MKAVEYRTFSDTFATLIPMSTTGYSIIALFIFLALFIVYSRAIYDKDTSGNDVFGAMFTMIVTSGLWQVMIVILVTGIILFLVLFVVIKTLNKVVMTSLNFLSNL